MAEQTRHSAFHRVVDGYRQAARDFNRLIRAAAREHDYQAQRVPDTIDALEGTEAAVRVRQAVDFLRDIADDLEAGLTVRLPRGVTAELLEGQSRTVFRCWTCDAQAQLNADGSSRGLSIDEAIKLGWRRMDEMIGEPWCCPRCAGAQPT